uniref:Uncharacterized protein n=1 Tax=Ascaris lumbricoides TaxID=6252 RepID=A0A0M3ITQ2_ASCLU
MSVRARCVESVRLVATAVSAKIRTLSEFHTRIASNQQPPSTAEILTTLRYFQQTLIGYVIAIY